MEIVSEQVIDEEADLDLLIDRARGGERRAFEAVYRRCVARVHALALRLTGERARAEELTQEAFVRAWMALPGFRGESRFSTWLHTITVRAHLDERRRAAVRRDREVSETRVNPDALAARRAMPGTEVDLERAIARLPPGAREVLVLHDIHGYTHREIGGMLGVTVGTTKRQLHRARALARSFLEEKETRRRSAPIDEGEPANG